jgi:hypothetical protein
MRVQQIRNIGVIEDNRPVAPNKWEEIKRGGDDAIKKWINQNIDRAECVVVLIGNTTNRSRWVDYEIRRAWHTGKGLAGIYIHNLKDPRTGITTKGPDPFKGVTLENGKDLSQYIPVYDPGADAYNWIAQHIETVVEKGIASKRKL